MEKTYKDLADLMLNSHEAQAFYSKLPVTLRRNISREAQGVRSLSQLENFAANYEH